VEEALKNDGLQTQRIPFADSNDLSMVLNANINDLDALYVPTDNVCADNATMIDKICRPAKLPVICGEEGICKGCGIATLSIDYFNLGVKTGEMAVEILKDGKDISKMPIAYDENPVKKFNSTICEELGITVPSGYVAIE
jgi:putative ABC transport system substrate-binding protein